MKSGFYLDDDNLIILQEKLAKEFITKELLQLASKYKVVGTDKLRKYNINSKLLCDFKHFNISYNELIKEHRWDRQLYG